MVLLTTASKYREFVSCHCEVSDINSSPLMATSPFSSRLRRYGLVLLRPSHVLGLLPDLAMTNILGRVNQTPTIYKERVSVIPHQFFGPWSAFVQSVDHCITVKTAR